MTIRKWNFYVELLIHHEITTKSVLFNMFDMYH